MPWWAELDADAANAPRSEGQWFKAIWHPMVVILSIYNLLGLTALLGYDLLVADAF